MTNDPFKPGQAAVSETERRRLVEAILDAEPGTVYIFDLDAQRNVFINRDWLLNFGYTAEETRDDADFLARVIHPDDLPRIAAHHAHFREAVDGEEAREVAYRLRKKDGEWRWVQSRDKVFTRDAQGRATQILGIMHDVTQSKQAQDAVRDSERKYRLLFENMTSGFAVHKMIYDDGGKAVDYRYLEVNPAFERLTGVPATAVLGKTLRDLMPNTEEYWIETFGKVATTGEAIAYTNFSREIGKHFDTYAFSPEPGFFAVVFNDVTDRVKARDEIRALNEELRKRVRELEDANAELTQFTYTVSHDLKSPLVTINGFLGYVEQDVLSGNLERFGQDVGRIREAVKKMGGLLTELLELSRIGRIKNDPVETPFADVVREALELVHGRIDEQKVTVQVDPDLPIVHGDRQRLIEVMQNLLDNAAKYLGEQTAPRVEVGRQGEENGMPILFVRDNGLGIAPEYHQRIFGLFNKLDPRSEGTGIGLALVKRVIELHGGRIWVESKPGEGSTFYFTLPGRQAR